MSAEIVRKALELVSADLDEPVEGSSCTKETGNGRKRKAKKPTESAVSAPFTLSKKARVKSVIEESLEETKTDYLTRNLRYLKYSQERKVDPEKINKILKAYDAEKGGREYWRNHGWELEKKPRKSIKAPCVFSKEDFKRWAATLKPNGRKNLL